MMLIKYYYNITTFLSMEANIKCLIMLPCVVRSCGPVSSPGAAASSVLELRGLDRGRGAGRPCWSRPLKNQAPERLWTCRKTQRIHYSVVCWLINWWICDWFQWFIASLCPAVEWTHEHVVLLCMWVTGERIYLKRPPRLKPQQHNCVREKTDFFYSSFKYLSEHSGFSVANTEDQTVEAHVPGCWVMKCEKWFCAESKSWRTVHVRTVLQLLLRRMRNCGVISTPSVPSHLLVFAADPAEPGGTRPAAVQDPTFTAHVLQNEAETHKLMRCEKVWRLRCCTDCRCTLLTQFHSSLSFNRQEQQETDGDAREQQRHSWVSEPVSTRTSGCLSPWEQHNSIGNVVQTNSRGHMTTNSCRFLSFFVFVVFNWLLFPFSSENVGEHHRWVTKAADLSQLSMKF